MRGFLILLLFIGILLMAIELSKNTAKCPEPKIIYKYVPRTFKEEQESPVSVTDVFTTMFTEDSPWITSIMNIDYRKQKKSTNIS